MRNEPRSLLITQRIELGSVEISSLMFKVAGLVSWLHPGEIPRCSLYLMARA